MIVIKVLVWGIIISVISAYFLQYGLGDSQRDDFYDSLINVVRTFGGKEITVILRHLNVYAGSNPEKYEDQHGGYGYGVRHRKGKGDLGFVQLWTWQ